MRWTNEQTKTQKPDSTFHDYLLSNFNRDCTKPALQVVHGSRDDGGYGAIANRSENQMNKNQLAKKLNGREVGKEITKAEEIEAIASGLVVVFGYSDDNSEIRGAIHDEIACYDGGVLKLHKLGVLPEHEERCDCQFCGYEAASKKCATVEALWDKEPGYCWTYKTDLPHATFDIMEEGSKFCRGIVLDRDSLPSL